MKLSILAAALFFTSATFAQVQTDYYANGKKRSEGVYASPSGSNANVIMASDGSSRPDPSQAKQGKWTYWYDTGKVSAEESYTSGTTSGIWKTWYPNGLLSSEINYTAQTAVFWYENGKKHSEGKMLPNRIFDGKWMGWHDNGSKSYEGNYKDGKKEGQWNWFDAKGKQTSSENYSNDVLIDSKKF